MVEPGPQQWLRGTHEPSGWFLLRAAMLPAATLSQWSEDLEAPSTPTGDGLADALDRDRARWLSRLDGMLERADVRRGLELASSSLFSSLDERHGGDDRRARRIERSLASYLSRFAARPAPFGLFAGVGVGRLGERTALRVPSDAEHRATHRIDVAFACELAGALARDPDLADAVRYVRAPTLTRAPGGRVRVIRRKRDGTPHSHEVVTFALTPPLRRMLDGARDGASIPALVELLGPRDERQGGRARAFVSRAIERGLLVCTLDPPVTGPDPLEHLTAELERVSPASPYRAALQELAAALADATSLEAALSAGAAARVRAAARALPHGPPADAELLRVVRTFPGSELTIGPRLGALIAEAAELTVRVGATGWPDVLGRLAERFSDRFELREIPLAEVFDDELGLGAAVLDEIEAELAPGRADRDDHILGLAIEAAAQGRREVVLSDRDVDLLSSPATLAADSLGVLVSLAASSPAALEAGDVDVLSIAVGLEAPRLLARFADALPDLDARLRELVRAERGRAGDALVADVILRHSDRIGNVVQRPSLYDWEIELIGRSGAPPERRLALDDLLVSVRDRGFRIRSAVHDRPVEPRQCSALMMDRRRPAAARFLWMFGQGSSGPAWAWSWGRLNRAPWLPRVRRGAVVLALERWIVDGDEAAALTRPRTAPERFAAVRAWRERRGIPREVDLLELDMWLRLDLEDVLFVDVLLSRLDGGRGATLREAWPATGRQAAVVAPGGGVVNELLVPFERVRSRQRPRTSLRPLEVSLRERRRPPGSEWLYMRLYGHPPLLERVLAAALAPACRDLVQAGTAELWFALPHADPDPHLRLRLRGDPERLLSDGLPRLRAAIAEELEDGRIRRLVLDTYDRELERYGGAAGLAVAERFFHADSELLARLLGEPGMSADRRYWLALAGVWWLWSGGADAEQERPSRDRLLARRDALLARLDPHARPAALFARQPRSDPAEGARWLEGAPLRPDERAAMLTWRDEAAAALAALAALAPADEARASIVGSLVHLHVHRLLPLGEAPRGEAQILDALARIAERHAARARLSGPAGGTGA